MFIRMILLGLLGAFISQCILFLHIFCGLWIATSSITVGDYIPFGIFFAHFFKVFALPAAIVGFIGGFLSGLFAGE